MRFQEVIKEAPISDIQPMGDPDPEIDQDYADPDEGIFKAWTEPEKRDWLSDMPKAKKWRSGVVKSWSKTKNNYLIIPVFGEEAYNYENLEKGLVPIIELATEFPEGYNFLQEIEVLDIPEGPPIPKRQQEERTIKGSGLAQRTSKHADKTVVFFLGNAADQWVRSSGWMLLHRLGHASRTTHKQEMTVNPAYSHALTLMFEQLQNIFANPTYDCSNSCIQITTANSGMGFYVESDAILTEFHFEGEVLTQSAIAINNGWNLVGYPLINSMDINSAIITYDHIDYNWVDAAESGIISPTPIVFDNTRASHTGTKFLYNGTGFWVHSFYDDVEISFIPSNPSPEVDESLYWNLSLFAKENTTSNVHNYENAIGSEVVIGIHENADDNFVIGEDQEILPLSGISIMESYTQLSINNNDISIYRDIRSFHKDSLSWSISVESMMPFNSGEGVTLTWDFSGNDEPYNFFLNQGNGLQVNMKEESIALLEAAPVRGARRGKKKTRATSKKKSSSKKKPPVSEELKVEC